VRARGRLTAAAAPTRAAAWRGDRGSGSVAAIGLVGALVGLAALIAPVAGISAARHRAAAGADASALAAAAVAAGLGSGLGDEPCTAAETVAARHGGALDACQIDGLVVTFRVVAATAFGAVSGTATAGPPGAG